MFIFLTEDMNTYPQALNLLSAHLVYPFQVAFFCCVDLSDASITENYEKS